jgi:DNA-binding NarL/FixJ family response regulator
MKVVLADDHELVRWGLKELLSKAPGWEVCGEASTGREAVEIVRKLKPDAAILDINMPELNGLDATRQIVHISPQTQVLILSFQETDELVREVLEAGARGFVLKSDTGHELLAALEALRRHSLYFSPRISEAVLHLFLKGTTPQEARALRLSGREREIVQLLAEGKSNKEVAAVLELSIKTVETHRGNIMAKLDLHSISDLVRYAIRNGIAQA